MNDKIEIVKVQLFSGSTVRTGLVIEEAEGNYWIEARGIHHFDLPKFIEAAPDLLTVCEALLQNFVPSRDKFTTSGQEKTFDMAKATIQKIRGPICSI